MWVYMRLDGVFYTGLKTRNNYSREQETCIQNTVQKLIDNDTSINRPGMLLGKIQSGKTKTFLGVIGLAFDNNYDLVIVLTKGTKALTRQTLQRLEQEFQEFNQNDQLQMFDIMALPDNLTGYELNQKMVIVSKKETNNLERLQKALFETYPELREKKILIIDDEADFASVGFKRTTVQGVEMNRIASQINGIRSGLNTSDFLQVTATPYSLYLQSNEEETQEVFRPIKPTFTELVPIHPDYIGGSFYFEESQNDASIASNIFEEIFTDELNILRRQDRRVFRVEDALITDKIEGIRDAILNFVIGGCIRRLQNRNSGTIELKYSFIIHTEFSRSSHELQEEIVRAIVRQFSDSIVSNVNMFNSLVEKSYENLAKSIRKLGGHLPTLDVVRTEVKSALNQGYLMITRVNSERDVDELLDDQGQLRLRTPLNIFIGGQILDRGITIKNLIGFYYGRRPNRFQQDTVLQHSRMYGFRPVEDLAVTRFYTTLGIHQVMKDINLFDSALREAFESGAHRNGIVFIRRDDQNNIVPCSPNKILLSSITTLRPYRRILPVGFQTKSIGTIREKINQIDSILGSHVDNLTEQDSFSMTIEEAKRIIDLISETFDFEDDFGWNVNAFKASLEYLSKSSQNTTQAGNVHCLIRTNRNLSRFKTDGSFSDAPDTAQSEGVIARDTAIDIPMLMLFKQNGSREHGWKGHPFWWPLIFTQQNTPVTVFASDLNENQS